ncbi:2-methylisocitrate lyase-like PEP mutase family enzyme [Bradyrhizobium sp. i1.8.4]|uniref:hypothetical protein n=1 Tax=unclassified Bradyrhizobium TaxID=2631580 RepID=UPI003D25D7C6
MSITGDPKMNVFRSHTHMLNNPMEFFGRIRAIKHRVHDPDFVAVARTEAMVCAFEGEARPERCDGCRMAGADAVLVHAKRCDADEVKAFTQGWPQPCADFVVPATDASTPISSGESRLPDLPDRLACLLRAIGRPIVEKGGG